MALYRSQHKLRDAPTDTLVVHCCDHRFQAGLSEFLNAGLGLDDNYDRLAIPGGPQSLLLGDTLPKYAWVSRKWLQMMVRIHALTRIVLIAHQDCGWYKWLYPELTAGAESRKRQEQDLRQAAADLAKASRQLKLDLYYAAWDASGLVTLDLVSR